MKAADLLTEYAADREYAVFIRSLQDYMGALGPKMHRMSEADYARIEQRFRPFLTDVGGRTVYRGINVEKFSDFQPATELRRRRKVRFNRFFSTSDKDYVARSFAESKGYRTRILFEMQLKPGCRGINVLDHELELQGVENIGENEIIVEGPADFAMTYMQRTPIGDSWNKKGKWTKNYLQFYRIHMEQT